MLSPTVSLLFPSLLLALLNYHPQPAKEAAHIDLRLRLSWLVHTFAFPALWTVPWLLWIGCKLATLSYLLCILNHMLVLLLEHMLAHSFAQLYVEMVLCCICRCCSSWKVTSFINKLLQLLSNSWKACKLEWIKVCILYPSIEK